MPFALFLLLVEHICSHQILGGPPGRLVDYYPTVPAYSQNLEFFPWYIMPLVNCIPCLLKHALLSILCYLFLKFVVYDPKMPRWVEPMPSPKPYEPESFRESYSSVVSPDKISTLQLHQKREVKWKVMHWRSGSRPWAFAFMPMDPMWNL